LKLLSALLLIHEIKQEAEIVPLSYNEKIEALSKEALKALLNKAIDDIGK
jgi:hypothetical protein